MSCRAFALLAVGGVATACNAAIFSFAPDNNPATWTFTGGGDRITDAQDPLDPQVLLVDDHSGPLPRIPFGTEFQADFTITYVESVSMGGGAYMHTYSVDGSFAFFDELGAPLLSAAFTNASMTAAGNALSWFTTARIYGTEVVYTWSDNAIPGYDILPGNSVGPDDFEFILTSLNLDGLDVPLDPDTHLPGPNWISEGAFKGTSHFIPVPGTAMVLGIGGVVMLRRRRAVNPA